MSINGHFGPKTQELALRLLPASGNFIIGTDSHHDADRYFDLPAIKSKLKSLGLEDENGNFKGLATAPVPDLSDLTRN